MTFYQCSGSASGSGSVRQRYGSEDSGSVPKCHGSTTLDLNPPDTVAGQLQNLGSWTPRTGRTRTSLQIKKEHGITSFTKFYLLSINYIYVKKAWPVGRGKLQHYDIFMNNFRIIILSHRHFMRKHRTGIVMTVALPTPTFSLTPYLRNAKFLPSYLA